MNTIPTTPNDGRRRRRKHSPEFKAHVVATCCKPGVSMASVALANGVNANLVRRWVLESEAGISKKPARLPAASTKSLTPVATNFVPVQLPPAAPGPGAEIRIELQRGATKVVMSWPASAASECAAWMRELLR